MNVRIFTVGFALLCVGAVSPCAGGFWAHLSGRSEPAPGTVAYVLTLGTQAWVQCESRQWIGYAQSDEAARFIMRCADDAFRKAGWYVAATGDVPKGILVLVEDPTVWERMGGGSGVRRDALAIQNGQDLLLFWSGVTAEKLVRLAHEMIHYRIWLSCRNGLPLWLEEGLAGFCGYRIAEDLARREHLDIQMDRRRLEDRTVLSMDQLAGLTEYPVDPVVAQALYRQSEALVAALALRIGPDHLADFLHAICEEAMVWKTVLQDRYGFSDQDFQALEEEMIKQVKTGRMIYGDNPKQ